MSRLCAAAIASMGAVVCTWSTVQSAGQEGRSAAITGTVRVEARPARRLATAGVYPGRTVSLPAERDTSELDNVVVFVRMPGGAPAGPSRTVIRQEREEFVPHLVAVTAGSTVEFPNDDLIFHNVFSLSGAATFDLGRYPRNTSRSQVFERPGIVKVFCHLHSHMSAIVRVFDHPYFTIPDRRGRFSLPDVPAGTHEVVAWHERAGEVARSVTLEPDATAALHFSLPLTDPE